MNDPIVTDEMLEAACDALDEQSGVTPRPSAIRKALEAALRVQENPALTDEERERLDTFRAHVERANLVAPWWVAIIDRLTGRTP